MGVHGVLDQRDDGRVVLADARRAPSRRRDRDRPGRRPRPGGRRLHRRTRRARRSSSAVTRSRPARRASSSTPPPYAKTYPDETVAYFEDISDGVDGPLLVYNWPHGTSVDIGPELASRLVDDRHVVAIKDSTPNAEQFYETTKAVVDRVRVFGPFMSVEGFERLLAHGGDGFIGGGSLFGAPDAAVLGGVLARRPRRLPGARRARRPAVPEALAARRLGRPVYGAYQSQLKAIMEMIGQPGGEVAPAATAA